MDAMTRPPIEHECTFLPVYLGSYSALNNLNKLNQCAAYRL